MERFRDAFSMPKEMDFSSYEQWAAFGAKDMAERCHAKASLLLKESVAPPLDPAVREELDGFVARRKAVTDPRIIWEEKILRARCGIPARCGGVKISPPRMGFASLYFLSLGAMTD